MLYEVTYHGPRDAEANEIIEVGSTDTDVIIKAAEDACPPGMAWVLISDENEKIVAKAIVGCFGWGWTSELKSSSKSSGAQ